MQRHNIDQGWEMTEATGFAARTAEFTPVHLPHDASIRKPRSADAPTGPHGGFAWSGAVTYRKRLDVPASWAGRRVLAEFEGVYQNAVVSINGNVVAIHPYGYTSFHADLTPHLAPGLPNELTVVANNSAQPNSRWYSGTGIYRHVWLRVGPATHIRPWGVFVSTSAADADSATVNVRTELVGDVRGAWLRVEVLDEQGIHAASATSAVAGNVVERTLRIAQPRLWSVDTPNLYTLHTELLDKDGAVLDSERTTFGLRTISLDSDRGFRLNGVPMKLRGGCVHHDNGPLGAASHDRAEERRIALLKASGFNAVRCAHNPPAPAMLDACDRLGMLVIDESFDVWRMAKVINDYHLHFESHWRADTTSMVERDRNHPSVIMWSIGNEVTERAGVSDGVAWAKKQADLVRSLDPTRPITSGLPMLFEQVFEQQEIDADAIADADSIAAAQDVAADGVPTSVESDRWGTATRAFCEALDVVGYNYLYARYAWDAERFPERVVAGTETFPGVALATWRETEKHANTIGDFVWTAWDYLGESGIGKVDVDVDEPGFLGEFPYHLANCSDFDICGFKRPQSHYRDLLWGLRSAPWIGVMPPALNGKKLGIGRWSWDPVVESWTWPGFEGETVTVHVYAVDEEIELLVNGVSQGVQPSGEAHGLKAVFEVAYAPGEIVAVGFTNGIETSRHTLTTTGAPVALRLSADRDVIDSAFGDLAYITIQVMDAEGRRVMHAEDAVRVEVRGAGELVALGAADPLSEELYTGPERRAYQGRLLAIVRSTGVEGEIVVAAKAAGLAEGTARITAE